MSEPVAEVSPHIDADRDCGFVAGERYAIIRQGIVFPNGTLLSDTTGCAIPVGVVLYVGWSEDRGYLIESHAACHGSANEAAEVAVLVARAEKVLADRGVEPSIVRVEEGDCADLRRVDIEATGG